MGLFLCLSPPPFFASLTRDINQVLVSPPPVREPLNFCHLVWFGAKRDATKKISLESTVGWLCTFRNVSSFSGNSKNGLYLWLGFLSNKWTRNLWQTIHHCLSLLYSQVSNFFWEYCCTGHYMVDLFSLLRRHWRSFMVLSHEKKNRFPCSAAGTVCFHCWKKKLDNMYWLAIPPPPRDMDSMAVFGFNSVSSTCGRWRRPGTVNLAHFWRYFL